MSLWFVAGILAAVNPCGFVLLPTYLMYFLGLQGSEEKLTQRETLRKALKVSGSLSLGFMAVFVVAAFVANYATNWLTANAKYATGFFGVALIALGAAMLFGFKLPFMNPQKLQGQKDQTVASMFVYGVAYAIASLGCTIGFFISAVFATASRDGANALDGLTNGLAYAAGMAVLVGGLTVALAFANTSLVTVLRRGLQYMDRIAAAFVLISGVYLLWYFYWVDLKAEGDAITDWVTFRQSDVNTFLSDHRWGVTVALFSLLGATIAYVYVASRALLGGIVVATALGVGLIATDWPAAGIIAGAVLVAGVLGLVQDRHDRVAVLIRRVGRGIAMAVLVILGIGWFGLAAFAICGLLAVSAYLVASFAQRMELPLRWAVRVVAVVLLLGVSLFLIGVAAVLVGGAMAVATLALGANMFNEPLPPRGANRAGEPENVETADIG